MYKFIKIRHDIINNVMGIIRRWKNSIISLRLRFLEIPHKKMGVLRGSFWGFGCPCWSSCTLWHQFWYVPKLFMVHNTTYRNCSEDFAIRVLPELFPTNNSSTNQFKQFWYFTHSRIVNSSNTGPSFLWFGWASCSAGRCSGPSTLINMVGKRNLNGINV